MEKYDGIESHAAAMPLVMPPTALGGPAPPVPCGTCGASASAVPTWYYVYALGRIEARFPSPGIEKEFAQVVGRADTAGLTDRQTLSTVLAYRENRYLARELCWVFTVDGQETYILIPGDSLDIDDLIASLRPTPRATDVDVVIGVRGPNASPEMCNGLMLPIVRFDKIYSFDIDSLIKSIPRPKETSAKDAGPAAEEVFQKVMHITGNSGATDEHRALNYLAVRYPAIYAKTAEQFAHNSSLTAVDVRPSPLSGARRIVEVIFSFTNRATDVTDKFFVRLDVTEKFPFLVTRLAPYFDR
jgi:PatG C-terminal